MVAARDAEGLSNPEIEELVRDRQLNQHVLARWRKYLRESKASGEPVFRLWHAAAAIPDKEFASEVARSAQNRQGCLSSSKRKLDAKPIASLRDLAEAYAASWRNTIALEPFGDPDGDQLRAVVRGPRVTRSMCLSKSLN